MEKKHTTTCSEPLVVRETQIKTAMRYHFVLQGWLKSKINRSDCWWGRRGKQTLGRCRRAWSNVSARQFGSFLQHWKQRKVEQLCRRETCESASQRWAMLMACALHTVCKKGTFLPVFLPGTRSNQEKNARQIPVQRTVLKIQREHLASTPRNRQSRPRRERRRSHHQEELRDLRLSVKSYLDEILEQKGDIK